MNKDKVLVSLVKEQTALFNRDAPEHERILIHKQIQEYQKKNRAEA